jgi:CRISPR-associated protein Cas5
MAKIDLTLLKEIPQLTIQAELRIEPLAPLSMVSEMPGSFYKTLKQPSQKMVCGLIENVLGWQFDWKDRKLILDDLKKMRKKQKKELPNYVSGSTYIPLLMDYMKIEGSTEIELSEICFFDDYWSRCYRRSDSHKHINGCRYMDASIINPMHERFNIIDNNELFKVNEKTSEKDAWFKKNISSFPMYYSIPTIREYIDFKGFYIIHILMDEKLYNMLNIEIENSNIGYLGNSEGWINLELTKI